MSGFGSFANNNVKQPSPSDFEEIEVKVVEPKYKTERPGAIREAQEVAQEAKDALHEDDSVLIAEDASEADKNPDEDAPEEKNSNKPIDALSFANDIKLLLIGSPDYRLICHFLGINSVNDVKKASQGWVALIGYLVLESVSDFMEKEGYKFGGEVDFTNEGSAIPVSKQVWSLKKKEIDFTRKGLMFFEHPSGDKNKNIVFYVYTNPHDATAGVICHSTDSGYAKRVLKDLEEYAKEHNSMRGAKLRDINVLSASFTEVTGIDNYTWDKFYYEKNLQTMFELEIFGFLNNTERYNARGIYKRGIMTHGVPGTGKTTLGKIVCNYSGDNTVIWITPDLVNHDSVKLLYLLADFLSPVVLILEDIDLFTEDRAGVQGDTLRLGGLMNILDGINSVPNSVTLATTNRLELIENALKNRPGRFDRVVPVPALSKSLRRKMLEDRLEDCHIDSEDTMKFMVKYTEGWTGAAVQEYINSLNMYFIQRDLDNERNINLEVAKEVIETMSEFSFEKDKQEGKYFH